MEFTRVTSIGELTASVQSAGAVAVAVDVGGTNTRVALKDVNSNITAAVFKEKINSKVDLLNMLSSIGVALNGKKVVGASLAGPGPRNAMGTQLGPFSNYRGDSVNDKIIHKKELPSTLFPQNSTTLLNDLEAAAYGIASVSKSDQLASNFTMMWGPNDAKKMYLERGPYLIIAAGTGCGTGLVYLGSNGNIEVMPLEFGHVSVVTESAEEEWLSYMKPILKRGDKPPEYDDVVTGRGLLWAYNFYKQKSTSVSVPELTDPAEVAMRSHKGCPVAGQAMKTHYKLLMNLASNLTMGFVLGGVVVAGDNAMHNEPFLSSPENIKFLKQSYLSHTTERMGFQSRANVIRQSGSLSLNLLGAFFKAVPVNPSTILAIATPFMGPFASAVGWLLAILFRCDPNLVEILLLNVVVTSVPFAAGTHIRSVRGCFGDTVILLALSRSLYSKSLPLSSIPDWIYYSSAVAMMTMLFRGSPTTSITILGLTTLITTEINIRSRVKTHSN